MDRYVSHGHELQGVDDFRAFLGSPTERKKIRVTYVWLSDDDEEPLRVPAEGTWYDSRGKQRHRSSEYRLYYPPVAEEVVYKAAAGDTLFLIQSKEGPLLAIFCRRESGVEQQLLWLFGLAPPRDHNITQRDLRKDHGPEIGFAARYILDELEIEVVETETDALDKLLKRFGGKFPGTRVFSEFARKSLANISAHDNPDAVIMAWIEREEALFRRLEREIVGQRLEKGFMEKDGADIDGFIKFSLSVQNRRKSRVGQALEHHLEALFEAHKVSFARGAETENRNKPDFLFPGQKEYLDQKFPDVNLAMLGAKSTCKDRWRQVLSEAARIETKHLFTLEPGISENQTDEMRAKRLQLILPAALHQTYRPTQQTWLMNLEEFVTLVKSKHVKQ